MNPRKVLDKLSATGAGKEAAGEANKPSRSKPLLAGSIQLNALTASGSGGVLDRIMAHCINTPNTTGYDKAIDAAYLAHRTGGSHLHHLVDGHHDLFGAFMAARDVSPSDSLASEVFGTAAHLSKDLFSKMGLPAFSVDATAYQSGASWIEKHIGLSREWQADLLQINGMELFSGALSTACVVLGSQKGDAAALIEMAAGTGLSSVLAANPLSMVAACVALVLAIQHRKTLKHGEGIQRATVGAGGSGAAILTGTVLGGFAATGVLPLAISCVLALVAGITARKVISAHFSGPDTKFAPSEGIGEKIWLQHFQRTLDRANKSEASSILQRLASTSGMC